MSLSQVVFLTFLLVALTTAFSRGGQAEKIGGALLLVAAVSTPLAQRHLFLELEYGIALIDGLLLLALFGLALHARRRWIFWALGFQTLGVLTHGARLAAGPVHGDSYGHMLVLWSYFVLLSLLIGALIEVRPAAVQVAPALVDIRPTTAEDSDHALLVRLLDLHGLGSHSAVEAKRLIDLAGSYAGAVATSATRLRGWGFDQKIADALALARETTHKALKRKLEDRPCLANQQHVVDYLHTEMAHLAVEQFRVLYLNGRHRLIHDEVHGVGSVAIAPVYPREIVKRAIEVGAVQLVLVHNHPSGDPTPSRDDLQITRVIINAAKSVDVGIVDHIIIARSGHTSLRAAGLI